MKLFNKDFGNRLWGLSFGIWALISWDLQYNFWVRLLGAIVFAYFITFGVSRFTEEYRKIL
jgi:hypothetical protein